MLVGSSQVLFRDEQKQALEFAGAKTFSTGVVVLTYHPSRWRPGSGGISAGRMIL